MPASKLMSLPEFTLDLHFPAAGVDLSMPYDRQPNRPGPDGNYWRTTPVAQNVRAFEPGSARMRGGARPGVRKYIAGQVDSTNHIQELVSIIGPDYGYTGSPGIPGATDTAAALYYTTPSAIVRTNRWSDVWSYGWSWVRGSASIAAVADTVCAMFSSTNTYALIKDAFLVVSPMATFAGPAGAAGVAICTDGVNFFLTGATAAGQMAATAVSPLGVVFWASSTIGALTETDPPGQAAALMLSTVLWVNYPGTGLVHVAGATGVAVSPFVRASNADITANCSGYTNAGGLVVRGTTFGIPVITTGLCGVCFVSTSGTFTPAARLGLACLGDPPSITSDGTNFYLLIPWYSTSSSGDLQSVVVKIQGSDGTVLWTSSPFGTNGDVRTIAYVSAQTEVLVSGPTVSLSLLASSGAVTGGGIGSGVYGGGGRYSGSYGSGVTLPATGTIFDAGSGTSTSPPTGSPPASINFNRAVILLAVAGGTVKVAFDGVWKSVTNGTHALSQTAAVIRSADMGGKIYFADIGGPKYYDPSDNGMHTLTASAGTFPKDSGNNYPRLVAGWRGRLVWAGLRLNPNNLYFSAVNNATDYDYSPLSTSPTQAFDSSVGPQGIIGDVVTAIVPYTDDVLYVGGDHTVWMLLGDPADGGRMSLVSNAIGMAYGTPWCQDPYGSLYFVSNLCGIYSVTPGQQPQRISQAIEQIVAALNPDVCSIRLAWDDRRQGMYVFITPYAGPTVSAVRLFWEHRTQGWFVDFFLNADLNPLCCLSYQGGTASDRVVLIGSWDGYVRAFQDNAPNDDGGEIDSAVWIGPVLTPELDGVMVKEAQAVLGASSGRVGYGIHVSQTAEQALVSTAVATGAWQAGRNTNAVLRRSGHAAFVRISATNPWALENVRLLMQQQGKTRRRGF